MQRIVMITLMLFVISSCKSLKLNVCNINIQEDICICKNRDMLTGETLSEVTIHEMSHCDRGVVFRIQDSWIELDTFLLAIGRKDKKTVKNSLK